MIKVYKHSAGALLLIVLIFIAMLGTSYLYFSEVVYKNDIFKLSLGLVGIIAAISVLLIAFWTKYTVTEEGLMGEFGRMASSKELKWCEIYRVVYDPGGLGMCMYHVLPGIPWGKPLHFSSFIKNHRELLAEIAARAPQAILDEEIKELIEEYKKSR